MPPPRRLANDRKVQLIYDNAHRIHTAFVYPILAPNGSTVVLYSNGTDLTFLWKGGRVLEDPAAQNGKRGLDNDGDSHMLTSNADTTLSAGDDARSNEEALDPLPPFDEFSVHFDSTITQIALPSLPINVESRLAGDRRPQRQGDYPYVFSQAIVAAILCEDGKIHLVSVSLHPKTQARTEREYYQILVAKPRGTSFRDVPQNITMTWTTDIGLLAKENMHDLPKLAPRHGAVPEQQWTFVIATHDSNSSGRLSVYGIPITSGSLKFEIHEESTRLLRTEYLPAFVNKIRFSSAIFPSPKHTHLLLADENDVIRIYEPLPRAQTSLRSETKSLKASWLLAFRPPFESLKSTAEGRVHGTNAILDVIWADEGNSIILLLRNGHWGIWDFSENGSTEFQSALTGSFVMPFNLRSFVGHGQSLLSDSTASRFSRQEPKQLVPMTPNSRKVRQDNLFTSKTKSRPRSLDTDLAAGGLSISVTSAGETVKQALNLWYADQVFMISDLDAYRKEAAKSAKSRDKHPDQRITLYGAHVQPDAGIDANGEQIVNVIRFNDTRRKQAQDAVMVTTDHHLLFVYNPEQQERAENLRGLFAGRSTRHEDEQLLARGELDIFGVDRLLDGMKSGMDVPPRRVAFQI